MLAVVAELVPCDAGEEGHDAGDLFQHALGGVGGLGVTHAVHQIDDDLAVWFRACQGLPDPSHPLDPSLAVGEGAILFERGAGGENDGGHPGGFGQEDLLTDEKIEALQGLFDLVGVGVGLQNVFPDDPEGLEPAVDGRLHHLGALVSHVIRDDVDAIEGVVSVVIFGQRHVQIPRALMGLATHVGGALHVILPPQGVDARAGLADVAGD